MHQRMAFYKIQLVFCIARQLTKCILLNVHPMATWVYSI